QRSHARARPGLALAGRRSAPVEYGGDRWVRHLSRHRPHQLDDVGVHAPAMLSRAVLAHAQSGVVVAGPTDDEIEAVALHPHDDFLDQHAHDPLSSGGAGPLRMPGALDVDAKPEQLL